jgi:hypothetical protein
MKQIKISIEQYNSNEIRSTNVNGNQADTSKSTATLCPLQQRQVAASSMPNFVQVHQFESKSVKEFWRKKQTKERFVDACLLLSDTVWTCR